MTAESPAFAKAYDLLKWLLPATARFPRQQRFVLARQIEESAFALHRALLRALDERESALADADRELAALRAYLRLACELRFFSVNQYEHAARLVDELGRLIGGWKRRVAETTRAPTAPRGCDAGVGYRPARRVVEQQPDQPASGEPQQQHAGQPEQQHRVPLRE
ncbi:MAG: diversity-generating retroelement protein Avd [Candidatus Rokubacteria bacterium]|nr:diversity-generating retroelement protein Avd [Candidatus Rokubacteria bacterium]